MTCEMSGSWHSFWIAATLSSVSGSGWAQERPSAFGEAKEIPLYSGVAPGSEKWDYPEVMVEGKSGPQVKNVVRPTLLYFPAAPEKSVGTAMIVAPGGGNRTLMMGYEGVDIAKKLNDVGVDAFVLKYRLTHTGPGAAVPSADPNEPVATGPQAGQKVRELSAADGRRAVELVRASAAEFRVQPNRIGMIGFSAGGGPVRAAMDDDRNSCPDFAALIYATGKQSTAIPLPANAPPLFLAIASDDVAYESTVNTYLAWRGANVPAELHVYQTGAHGFVNKGGGADRFMDRVTEWMQGNGWLTRKD